jgi:2-keto-myo-inositol isomerase
VWLGLNGATIMSTPWRDEIRIAARARFVATEARQNKVRDFLATGTLIQANQMLEESGLRRGPLNALLDVVYGRPETEVDEECAWLCEISQQLGFPGIVATPGPRPQNATWPEIRAEAVKAYSRLGDIGERYGMGIGVEFIGTAGASMTTLEQAHEVMRGVGRDNVRLVVDLFSFYLGGSSLAALSHVPAEDIMIAHLADCPDPAQCPVGRFDRLLPGDGVAPLGQMVSTLRGTGYDGLLCVEVFNKEIWERDPMEVADTAYKRSFELLEQAEARSIEIEIFGALLPPEKKRQRMAHTSRMTVRDVAARLGLDPEGIGLATIDGVQVMLEAEVPKTCRVCLFPPMSGG